MARGRRGQINADALKLGGVLFLIITGMVLWCYSGTNNYYNKFFGRYSVIGTVDAIPEGKVYNNGQRSVTEKYGVALNTDQGPRIVNCDSTQCGSLRAGRRVELRCYREWHLTMPTEEECRFKQLLP